MKPFGHRQGAPIDETQTAHGRHLIVHLLDDRIRALLVALYQALGTEVSQQAAVIRTATGLGGVISLLPAGLGTSEATSIGLQCSTGPIAPKPWQSPCCYASAPRHSVLDRRPGDDDSQKRS